MRIFIGAVSFALIVVTLGYGQTSEADRLRAEAARVTITRDTWGIAHVHGPTDADAVFGAIYAQAEDDFNRVETNYINSTGRLAETEGEGKIWQDLRMKLFVDPAEMQAKYRSSPDWLKRLMNAWADGLNYYLATHPQVKPRVITHFEPWMPLSFSEGSIGGDIETINLERLKQFYGENNMTELDPPQDEAVAAALREPGGSNGMAIAPSNTKDHHALLLINPHTSFYFRSELQMTSDEGLNAYGASTWGQFFIYQGWNEHCGWMHTSSAVDAVDEYKETIVKHGGKYFYKYGPAELPVTSSMIRVPYRTASGMAERTFTVYRTQHGPIVREADGKWISVRLMQEPVKALTQSFSRTKAHGLNEFRDIMKLEANSSNNTLFADADGNIAFFEANFIPRRDPRFDWTRPVDGSDPATDWNGLLSLDEQPHVVDPKSGWVYNSNDWPWAASGPDSPKRSDYPRYVDNGVESARGRHAVIVLKDKRDFTLESLNRAAYDSYLPWFEDTLPALLKAWDGLDAANPLKARLADQISALRSWNMRWGTTSVPTSIAVYWAEDVTRRTAAEARQNAMPVEAFVATKATPAELLQSLDQASSKLVTDFGKWQTPWGDINRFQRLTDDLVQPFTDAGSSIPVEFTSAIWGSLASFAARPYNGSKKIYGSSGNSFVAVVEFGPRVRAHAVTAGGESGDPRSKHFDDQAARYSTGDLREVYFYPDQLKDHVERKYHPGE